MREEDVLSWNRAVPFVPYRIRLVTGRAYDIRHPEMVKVGRSAMTIYSYRGDTTDRYEKVEMIGVVMIETIEAIATASSTSEEKS